MLVSGQPVAVLSSTLVRSKMILLIDNPKYVDLDCFIDVIRENPIVWNSNLPEYHNRRVVKESIARVAAAVNATGESAEFCMVNHGESG